MTVVAQYTPLLLLLLGLVWLPGYALERWLHREGDLGGLCALARLVLGVGFWIAIAFSLAAVGWLRPVALYGVAASAAGGALWARRIRGRGASAINGGHYRPPLAATWAGSALVCALLAPFYLLTMSPEVSWDADVYHLTLPRLFLEHGGFRPVPMSIYSQWPLGTELLFALAMLVKDFVLAKLVHFCFGVLTIFALALGCHTFHRGASGTMAALFFLANPVVLTELHIAYVDLAYAFFFTAAFLFALNAAAAEGDPACDPMGSWLLSGLCCGAVAGLKVTGILAAPAIGVLVIPQLLAAKGNGTLAAKVRRFAACFGVPVLVLWLPWLAKAWFYTGNPIHPLGYALFGGVDWSPTLAIQFARWQESIGMGRGVLDYALLPLRVILQGGADYAHFDGAIGRFWIVLLPLTLVCGWKARLVRSALAVSGVYFVAWAFSSQQMRFLIPILPLLAMAGATTVVDLFERLGASRGQWLRRITVLAFGLGIATLYRGTMARGLEVAWRTEGEVRAQAAAVVPGVFRFIGNTLPRDAVLLFINSNRGFFCPREYRADSFFQASQVADWLRAAGTVVELRALLQEGEITHILFDDRKWGIRYPKVLSELLRNTQQVDRIYESANGRLVLYELL